MNRGNVRGFAGARPATSYGFVRDEGGAALAARTDLDIRGLGAVVTDDPATGRTRITVPGYAPDPILDTSRFYQPLMFGNIVAGGTYQRLYLIPFYVHEPLRYLESVTVFVDTAVASSTVRVGLFGPSDGMQTNRIRDMGTVSSATTGVKTVTASSGSRGLAVAGGTNYIAVAMQAVTGARLRFATVAPASQFAGVPGQRFPATGAYFEDAVTGAFGTESFAPFFGDLVPDCPQVLLAWTATA